MYLQIYLHSAHSYVVIYSWAQFNNKAIFFVVCGQARTAKKIACRKYKQNHLTDCFHIISCNTAYLWFLLLIRRGIFIFCCAARNGYTFFHSRPGNCNVFNCKKSIHMTHEISDLENHTSGTIMCSRHKINK